MRVTSANIGKLKTALRSIKREEPWLWGKSAAFRRIRLIFLAQLKLSGLE